MKEPGCIEFLKCFFTPEERSDISERLARAMAQKLEAEEEFDSIKQQFKDRITGYENEANKLARRLNFGYEHRSVVCTIMLDSPAPGKKTIVRTDTGELVSVRDMEDSDRRQVEISEPAKEPESAKEPEPQTLPGMETAAQDQADGATAGQ